MVRVKRPSAVINERRTGRRISDEEMGLGGASASHGQDEQGAEDVRQVIAGHGQDKQKQGAEDDRQVPAGCGQDKQGVEGGRQTPACCWQSRVGPEPPSQQFLSGNGIEYIQEIHLDQEI